MKKLMMLALVVCAMVGGVARAQDVVGDWQGSLDLSGGHLRMVVKVSEGRPGRSEREAVQRGSWNAADQCFLRDSEWSGVQVFRGPDGCGVRGEAERGWKDDCGRVDAGRGTDAS